MKNVSFMTKCFSGVEYPKHLKPPYLALANTGDPGDVVKAIVGFLQIALHLTVMFETTTRD